MSGDDDCDDDGDEDNDSHGVDNDHHLVCGHKISVLMGYTTTVVR